ncbi:MAG: cysteine desulfurase [Candidatus Rokubacteria bacterium]|nr:cysteine desulfurase [Candidatus Rokubacteria bacterium]MBI2555658.1 cysteine desulfurase [Candidatus Rokubacteria bacterium]
MEPSGALSSRRPDRGRVYLDYGGLAPVDPRVVAVMRPFLEGGVGNPSSLHSLGSAARESLEAARLKVARLVGGSAAGLLFTSGATEANNLAIKGVAPRASERGRHVVTSSIEHMSVLNPCRDLEKGGMAVTYLPVDADGRVDPDALRRAIRPDTVLISIMAANGEIGTVQEIAQLGRVAREHGIPFHVDGVGAVGRLPLSVEEMAVDLLTLSSNDLYGPPGAGALWVRPGVKLLPQILGGGQEGGLRSGTENLPAIVGMGVAAELVRAEWRGERARLCRLRDRLLSELLAAIPGCRLTGSRAQRLPHHLSLCLHAVKADGVLMDLDLHGVGAASGSACASKTLEPSHVLRAIGADPEEQEGSLCFTLGRWSTAGDIEAVLELLPPIVSRLRAFSPKVLPSAAS